MMKNQQIDGQVNWLDSFQFCHIMWLVLTVPTIWFGLKEKEGDMAQIRPEAGVSPELEGNGGCGRRTREAAETKWGRRVSLSLCETDKVRRWRASFARGW